MRRVVYASVAIGLLCGPVSAQHWIPPRPGPNGIDICSGWDTAAAQQKCVDDEFAAKKKIEDDKRAAEDRWRAIREAADVRARAAQAESDRLAADRAEQDRKRSALDVAAAERRKDDAQRAQERADTEAAVAAERAREAEEARAIAAKEAQARREKLVAKMKADADARAQEAARIEASDPFKRVDALDLQVSPEDFVGKPVRVVGLQCYAPSPAGRRCLDAEASVMVQPLEIGPVEVQSELDRSCGAVRSAISDGTCRWTARFVLDAYRIDKTDDGTRRVVLLPKSVALSR